MYSTIYRSRPLQFVYSFSCFIEGSVLISRSLFSNIRFLKKRPLEKIKVLSKIISFVQQIVFDSVLMRIIYKMVFGMIS